MAGAISEVARQSLATDFRPIDPTTARIVLIEAGQRIMPALPQEFVATTCGAPWPGRGPQARPGTRCGWLTGAVGSRFPCGLPTARNG